MFTWGEIDGLERQLKASIAALNKKVVGEVTLIEAVDEVMLWPKAFDELAPIAPNTSLDNLISRAPFLICAVASEIGFRFEGVGTVFWAKLSDALGLPITTAQRARIGSTFNDLAARYKLSRPSESAFSSHFSIISWPIANALLPVDLVGPATRLMARAPVTALPGSSRAINLPSLRAWASAAEGARLVDWLRFEAPTTRVLTALLTENRGGGLSQASYTRLRDAIATEPEAFFAARAAQLRARTAKAPKLAEQTLGRLALELDATGVRMFVSWPALAPALFDDARAAARSANWRPRLWGGGGFLHPDRALSEGPFAVTLSAAPADDNPAYSGAAQIFGPGSDAAAALAARVVDWNANLLFEPNAERTQAEQRFDVLTGTSGYVWVATKAGGATLHGLRRLGSICGYTAFEANLADAADRATLMREDLLSRQSRSLLARHPIDAIGAPQGVVRPGRPFLLYKEGNVADDDSTPQRLASGARIASVSGLLGRPGLRAEPALPVEDSVADVIMFERDRVFEALIERRLQLRVGSRLPLVDVPVTTDLEIGGQLIARGHDRLAALPMTVSASSALLSPLYSERVRAKLLESGKGKLRITVGRSIVLNITLERPAASVDWAYGAPQVVGADLETELVGATAYRPHRFVPTAVIGVPSRGAMAYGLRLSDDRIADPVQIFTTNIFDLGDFAAHFGDDVGSRRMFENGRGVGDIARARVAWARGLCASLPAVLAKTRIVRQFEEPLVIDLCGRPWYLAEQTTRSGLSDPHDALWHVVLERGLATLPQCATSAEVEVFARAFRRHARELDPGWPIETVVPADGAMDDALNAAFFEAVAQLHQNGALLDIGEDDFDFGSPAEDWEAAAADALRMILRPGLARMIAPSEGGRQLSRRSYAHLSIAELAEDMSAWTRAWALPRGRLTPETAAGALQLWLSPGACDDVDAAVRVLVADPFVSRATRYAALRLATVTSEASA